MAFSFSLEMVLKHRKRLEEIAQREFVEAQGAVDQLLHQLEQMYQRMDEVRIEIANIQAECGPKSLDQIRSLENFLSGHKIRIETTRQEARALLVVAEEKQEAMIASSREHKVLEKLKEKRFAEYKKRLEKMETKAFDEQTMMRHSWGKR